jgi:hypothetical protein
MKKETFEEAVTRGYAETWPMKKTATTGDIASVKKIAKLVNKHIILTDAQAERAYELIVERSSEGTFCNNAKKYFQAYRLNYMPQSPTTNKAHVPHIYLIS